MNSIADEEASTKLRESQQRIVSESRVITAGFNSLRSSTDRLNVGTGLRTKVLGLQQQTSSQNPTPTTASSHTVRDIRDAKTA
jgi:hypothetical protein